MRGDEVSGGVTTTEVVKEEEADGSANGPYDLSLSPPTKRIMNSNNNFVGGGDNFDR